ncbi:TonB-dependent receptor plug domain-containing protein [[Mannheimia] succiniciproducens]|nr:TonB-dependent receptor [[Mannheimia] succiniciproducens]
MKLNLITSALLFSTIHSSFAVEPIKTELTPIEVYSAYAIPVNQDQTASSLTVLTEKDFAGRNAAYVSDVLKTVPGVAFGINGGRGATTSLFLRGADSNHTTVIIDGVRMNPINGNGFDFGGLALSNIERIEVLRGEQSALWGSNAMGGVIYITTKSGLYKEKPFNVDFDLGTGSRNTRDASATISGYNKGFYYALHGDSHRTKGISALSSNRFNYTALDGTKVTTGGAGEQDGFHRDNASIRLGYDDANKGLELLAQHSSQSAHYDNSLAEERLFNDYMRTRETLFKLAGYWGSEHELFKHSLSASHLKTDNDTFSLWASAYDAKRLNTNYQLDINFDRDGATTQSFSILGEYQKSKYDSTSYTDEKALNEKSIAAEYRLFHENGHSLSLSGRYTDNSKYDDTFTGRIAGAYRLSPNLKTHASFASAVQNPTFIEYFGYYGSYAANEGLKAERSRGGDIGLLIESTDKHHSLDITYFARNVDNFISSELVDPVYYIYRSINLEGTTKIRGVEIAYNGQLTDNLTAYANYTFTRSKDSQGDSLVRRPKHQANAGLNYQITEKFGSNVNIAYVGKRIDNYYEETYPYAVHAVNMPSYTLLNLGVNYQLTSNINIYANLNNLFDKKYENILGYGQDGRNVYVGLKGSF